MSISLLDKSSNIYIQGPKFKGDHIVSKCIVQQIRNKYIWLDGLVCIAGYFSDKLMILYVTHNIPGTFLQ